MDSNFSGFITWPPDIIFLDGKCFIVYNNNKKIDVNTKRQEKSFQNSLLSEAKQLGKTTQIHRLNQNRAQANHFGGFYSPL